MHKMSTGKQGENPQDEKKNKRTPTGLQREELLWVITEGNKGL